jgi:hypothetical protein
MTDRFSQRIGVTPRQPIVQLDDMNVALRNSLWNVIHQTVESRDAALWRRIARRAAIDFFKWPVDELPIYDFQSRDWIKQRFYDMDWYRAYDFVEFFVQDAYAVISNDRTSIRAAFNHVLEREGAGYRFIAGVLSPISNSTEVAAVSEAISSATQHALLGASEHLSTAVALLGQRPDPDYRNSVKESISAIESLVKSISGQTTGGLAGALEMVAAKAPIHRALQNALRSLYGYTSDESGIRHAILDDPTVGYEEAKFMLVSCSAFVNFLVAKADHAGLLHK